MQGRVSDLAMPPSNNNNNNTSSSSNNNNNNNINMKSRLKERGIAQAVDSVDLGTLQTLITLSSPPPGQRGASERLPSAAATARTGTARKPRNVRNPICKSAEHRASEKIIGIRRPAKADDTIWGGKGNHYRHSNRSKCGGIPSRIQARSALKGPARTSCLPLRVYRAAKKQARKDWCLRRAFLLNGRSQLFRQVADMIQPKLLGCALVKSMLVYCLGLTKCRQLSLAQ